MSTTNTNANSSIEVKEERELNLLERILFGSKIAAGILALTYVSGYLIATTYLATYGISASASELLRAKYIYIGCQYWMFVAAFGLLSRVIQLRFNLWNLNEADFTKHFATFRNKVRAISGADDQMIIGRARDLKKIRRSLRSVRAALRDLNRDGAGLDAGRLRELQSLEGVKILEAEEKGKALEATMRAIEIKEIKAEYARRSTERTEGVWNHFRWVLVVTLILGVFAFEIMLLKPGDISAMLPLHALLLLSIALYQTTFYMEYSSMSYRWGFLDGRFQVDWMRWMFGAWIGVIVTGLILWRAVCYSIWFPNRPGIIRDLYRWPESVAVLFVMVSIFFAASFVTLSDEDLRNLDTAYPLSRKGRRRNPTSWKSWKAFLYASTLLFRTGTSWSKRFKSIVFVGAASLFGVFALLVFFFKNGVASATWFGHHHVIYIFWKIVVWLLYYGSLCGSLMVLSNILILTYMNREMHKELKTDSKILWHGWVLLGVAVTVLYVVSVFGFAYLVYPFISFEKAGGRYSAENAIVVDLVRPSDRSSEAEFTGLLRVSGKHAGEWVEAESTERFLILEEDANWTYLAPLVGPTAGGGPDTWKWWALCQDFYGQASNSGYCRPNVYAVNRRFIASIRSVPR